MTENYVNAGDWASYVESHCLGVLLTTLRRAVMDAAVDLSENSHIWRHENSSVDVEADKFLYTPDIPSGSRVATVVRVEWSDALLVPSSIDLLDEETPGWRTKESQVSNTWYWSVPDQAIRLFPIPDTAAAGVLFYSLALKPRAGSQELPQFFWEDWRETIALGALSRLLNLKGEPWYEPNLAELKRSEFRHGITMAMQRQKRGGSRGILVRRQNSFGMIPLTGE